MLFLSEVGTFAEFGWGIRTCISPGSPGCYGALAKGNIFSAQGGFKFNFSGFEPMCFHPRITWGKEIGASVNSAYFKIYHCLAACVGEDKTVACSLLGQVSVDYLLKTIMPL